MLPPPGTTGSLIGISDAFDVPVFVRTSTPLHPEGRPGPTRVAGAVTPWPAAGVVPPPGAYRVGTTWRDVIDAATTVGRDPTPWLATVRSLARAEIVARSSPLFAYLGRAAHPPHHGGAGFLVEPNVVYTDGAEITARAAVGYRIGMTMAEWACRGLLGVGSTVHAEAHTPMGAGPAWSSTSGLPDLVGYHLDTGLPWLVEAKGAGRLQKRALTKGAEQLRRPGLMHGPHVKVLCGTSLTDRLFVTLDVEELPGTPLSPVDGQLFTLARSRMLHYLALTALPTSALRVLPVGPAVADRHDRRNGVGTVTLLEEDPSTTEERVDARQQAEYQERPATARFDMLTGRVPGTNLVLGMSRSLFGACAALVDFEVGVASDVDAERPHPPPDASEDEVTKIDSERMLVQRQSEQQRRVGAAERVRQAYASGANRSWEQLRGDRVEFTADPVPGFLEAATEDTYLAVNATAISTARS